MENTRTTQTTRAGLKVERTTAGEIKVGDRIARAKTHPFNRVLDVVPGPVAVRLRLDHGGSIRPNKTAQLWRVVEEETTHA